MKMHNRGFSLMEALIVAVVLAMLGAVMMTFMLTRTKDEARTDFREVESRELSLLYGATKAYMDENPTVFTATPSSLALETLISNGKLPEDFATRDGVMGKTPWRQNYQIFVTLDATDNKPRAVILEGSPAASVPALNRTGMESTPQAISALKSDIAVKTMSAWKVPAATIDAGTKSARGAMNAWTKDLTAFLPNAPTQAAAAVLAGFPDLEPQPPTFEVDYRGRWKNCTLQHPSARGGGGSVTPAACPIGQQNLVHVTTNPITGQQKEGFPFCRTAHHWGEPHYTSYPTDIGNLTIGSFRTTDPVRILMGWQCNGSIINYECSGSWTPQYALYENMAEGERIFLNGAEIAEFPSCTTTGVIQGAMRPNCTVGTLPSYSEEGCALPTGGKHNYVNELGSDARVLLCCEEVTP